MVNLRKKYGLIYIVAAFILAVSMNLSFCLNETMSIDLKNKFEKKINLDLRDMDIIDVFKFISMKGDFSIVVSKAVTGRVTLVLKSVKIVDSLDIICLSNNLGYRSMGNIVYVMPEQEYFQMYGTYFRDKTRVKIVFLKYIKPSYALEALKNIKSEIGKLVIDEETGTIVMVDIDEKLTEMQKILDQIDKRLDTKIFSLNYAKAQVIKEKLREKLDVKSVGSIEADERSNQVIVTALPERFIEIESIIRAMDKKTKEVLIKVKIIKLILHPQFDFGIDWERAFQKAENAAIRSLHLYGSFPASATLTAATATTYGRIMLGDIDSDEFAMTLNALKQVSQTKTLANPTILVNDNEEAKIHIGDKLAYVTTTTIGTGADQTSNEEVHYIDVGILLHVKPTIGDDGFVRMYIKPEISSQRDTLETPAGSEIPLINTTLVESTVMVKDGTSIVIGGLRKDENQTTKKGLPYLMDLPVFGNAFKNISDDVTKAEIVIILTPHIIDAGVDNIGAYTPTLAPMKTY